MRSQLGLLGGRLLATTLVLGASLLLARSRELGDFAEDALALLMGATYFSALAVAITLPRVRDPSVLAWAQIGWDLCVVTGLVYLLGGAGSGFSFLYGVVILAAALAVGTRATFITAATALTLYLGVSIGLESELLPLPTELQGTEPMTSDELGLAILRNILGLMLVGLLAGTLAARLRATGGELKRAEESARGVERLNQDILRSLSSGLMIADLEGVVMEINPAGARLLLAEPTELVGVLLHDLLTLGSETSLDTPLERSEGVARRRDNTTFPVGFSLSPLRDADDSVRGTLVLFQDLTELRHLRETAARAERLAALGRLSASLAHEIRNPLGSILGSVQMVTECETLPDEDRRLLSLVLGEVDRLDNLVSTMLDVSRPREPDLASVDLGALASDVANVARRSGTGVKIEIRVPPAEVRVEADAAQLRQVLWNLVKNALQVSRAPSTVTIEVVSDERSASIAVRDQGPGIAPEDRDHLFEMFYTKRHHGVGLGLALVRQIVDAHHAQIDVESEPGQGASFTVRFAKPKGAPSDQRSRGTVDNASTIEGARSASSTAR